MEREAVRCGRVESLGLDAEALLVALRARTRRTTPSLNLAYDSQSLAQWADKVRDVARHGYTAEDFDTLGEWIVAGGLSWWRHGTPRMAFLLTPGRLAQLLEDAATWHRDGRPPLHTGRPPVVRAGAAPVSPEFLPDASDDDMLRQVIEAENANAARRQRAGGFR